MRKSTAMATDLYAVLGMKKDASADELRKAYKKLSRENHPDRKPNDAAASEKFKQVQEAWDVLGDATKRQQYDRFGSNGPQFQQGQRRGSAGPVDFQGMFGGNVDLGDLLGGMFGGGAGGSPFGPQAGRRARSATGANIEAEIEIPFVVATEGGMQDLQLDHAGKPQRLSVKIPPGVSTGSVIRLAGQGQAGRGGPAGDLLVTIKVAPHSYFRREGSDLLIDVPLTVSEAALGTKVEVPTLAEGPMVVTIPPGTSSGAKLRLRGKGVPNQKTRARGDLYVVIKLVLPPKLDDATRGLFEQIAVAAPYDPRVGLW